MVTVRLPLTQVCGLAVLAVAALLTYKLSSSPFTAARRVAAPSLVLQPCAALPTADERLFGPPLPRVRLDDETPKFEPAAYRRYYPDAAAADPASGPDDNASAGAHYLEVGRTAGRVPVRLRVLFSYEASAGHHAEVIFGGLCNQMYSHIGMLTLALHMGAEPVLPKAAHRGGNGFKDEFNANKVQPVRAPLATLFDVEHLLAWGVANGAPMHLASPGRGDVTVAVNGSQLCCMNSLEALVGTLSGLVVSAAEEFMRSYPGRAAPVVNLDVRPPLLLFALRTDTPLAGEIAQQLRPAPHIRRAADAIAARLSEHGGFNGIHLRMEADANMQGWASGGIEALWTGYEQTMRQLGFDQTAPLYVASGLLTYMDFKEFNSQYGTRLTKMGLCSNVLVKERIWEEMPKAEVPHHLPSEALAYVDLLVLVAARRFAGFSVSSLSLAVVEYRCLAGRPDSTAGFANLTEGWAVFQYGAGVGLSDHATTCPEPA